MDWRVYTDHLGGVIDSFGGPFRSISEVEMQEFEKDLGFAIPQEYRSFLLQFGSGFFLGSIVFTSGKRSKALVNLSRVSFYGKRRSDGRGESVLDGKALYRGKIPEGFLPIASCKVGAEEHGALFLRVGGERDGSVYYWINPRFGGECQASPALERKDGLCFLSTSFLEFIKSLRDVWPLPDL